MAHAERLGEIVGQLVEVVGDPHAVAPGPGERSEAAALRSGTSRAAGSPRRVITISSPPSTRSTSSRGCSSLRACRLWPCRQP